MGPSPPAKKYLALSLTKDIENRPDQKPLDRYGIPFLEGRLPVPMNGAANVDVDGSIKRIFLLGMTESASVLCWGDPCDYSIRFFVGDDLGKIHLDYADGSTQDFPLILGEVGTIYDCG